MSGGKKKVTVGYRYYLGIHMGVGVGPVDEFVEFEVGGRTAFNGSVTTTTQIYINKPNLFGGDSGEGGIQGTLDVMMGAPDQIAATKLATMLGGLVPGFRGMATVFYDGLVSAMNPYPKPWRIRHRRTVAGWDQNNVWYPTKAAIWLAGGTIKAMNPAHIIYQCLTDSRWGAGIPTTLIDQDAFTAAADTLYSENFGICIRWSRQDALSSFIQMIQNHIGANIYISRTTGKVVMDLVRDDYDPESLPAFTPGNGLLRVEEDEAAALSTNELLIEYVDPLTGDKRQVRAQNIASIQAQNGVISESRDYLGLPIASLALRVAQRDLAAMQVPRRYKVVLDKRGYSIPPGGVFKISHPDMGIDSAVLRAGRIEEGGVVDPEITITAVLDVFGLPATSFVGVQEPNWSAPDTAPYPITVQRAFEVPYFELAARLVASDLAALDEDAAFVAAMGLAPTDLSRGYAMMTRVSPAAYDEKDRASWVPYGVLPIDMPKTHDPVAVSFTVFRDFEEVEVGSAAMLGDEILRVVAIDFNLGTATLARGCGDTVPTAHSAGTIVWFYDSYAAEDQTEYVTTDSINIKLLTVAGSGILDEASATPMTVVANQRQERPYPPGKLLIEGVVAPEFAELIIDLSWEHRDRVLQADQLVDTTAGSIGPEAGTTYSVVIKRADTMAVVDSQTGITGTSTTMSPPYSGLIVVEVFSVRDGLASFQKHSHTMDFLTGEVLLVEDGDVLVTESGEILITES